VVKNHREKNTQKKRKKDRNGRRENTRFQCVDLSPEKRPRGEGFHNLRKGRRHNYIKNNLFHEGEGRSREKRKSKN